MVTRRSLWVSVSLVSALVLADAAWATMDNLKTFKQAYPPQEGKTYSCKVCHLNAIGKKGELNAYGLELQKLKGEGNAKALTKEDIESVGKKDADGDGVSNADEIKAGTGPGDPKSFPPKP